MNIERHPGHHPHEVRLLEYASGTLSPLFSDIVRAHLGVCGHCRDALAFAEKLGGDMLGLVRPATTGAGFSAESAARIAADCDLGSDDNGAISLLDTLPQARDIEQLVATYLDSSLDALPWKRSGKGLALCRLSHDGDARMWLLRGAPGTVLPDHTHRGDELTLVLKGAYFCGNEIYRAGDIEDADEDTTHQPVITRDGECICLAVTEGALRFQHWLPRLAQPFLGI